MKEQRIQWLGHIMRRSDEEKPSEQLWNGNQEGKGPER